MTRDFCFGIEVGFYIISENICCLKDEQKHLQTTNFIMYICTYIFRIQTGPIKANHKMISVDLKIGDCKDAQLGLFQFPRFRKICWCKLMNLECSIWIQHEMTAMIHSEITVHKVKKHMLNLGYSRVTFRSTI